MRRRDFSTHLGGLTAALIVGPSLSGTRLRAADLPRIGILDPGLPGQFAAFFAGMRDLGYVKEQNVVYVERSAAGQPNLVPRLAAELVAAKVAVIVTAGPLPVRAASVNGRVFSRGRAGTALKSNFTQKISVVCSNIVQHCFEGLMNWPSRNDAPFNNLASTSGAEQIERSSFIFLPSLCGLLGH